MNLQEILNAANVRLNKDQSGNTLSPEEYNSVLALVNIDYFKKKYGLPEQYRGGAAPAGYEVTQKFTDDMVRFREVMGGPSKPHMKIDSNGRASIPSDYVHYSSIRYVFSDGSCSIEGLQEVPVEVLTDAQWGDRIGDAIKKPSRSFPVAKFEKNYIDFRPKDLQFAEFSYLRLPKVPFYDYNIVNDVPVFLPVGGVHDGSVLPSGSSSRTVELEWPEDTHTDIVNLIVSVASENLREQFMKQASEVRKIQGE